MEYYGLRKSGRVVDFIACEEDVVNLIRLYPTRAKDLFGDLGVCPGNFEIWKSICLLSYDDLKPGAVEENDYLIISLEKLLLMKVLAMKIGKYLNDTQLLVEYLLSQQYRRYSQVKSQNEELLRGIEGVVYLERTGG